MAVFVGSAILFFVLIATATCEHEWEEATCTVAKTCTKCGETEGKLFSTYRVATSGGYDNVIYVTVYSYGSNSRILEDDWITVYGEFGGLYTYTTGCFRDYSKS